MPELGTSREVQCVLAGYLLDNLILALKILTELEILALSLKPDLLLPVRPCINPLLDESNVVAHESVLITDPSDDHLDFVERKFIPLLPPCERVSRDSFVRVPESLRVAHRLFHVSEGGQDVALAAPVRPVNCYYGEELR